jgi:predicted thioesterase
MNPGICGSGTLTVTQAETAQAMGSGTLPVFATPSMIALMENTAYRSVAPYLEPGQSTVGTSIQVRHTSATPVGMEVRCEAELVEVDRKRLVFSVKAYDAAGLIGEGTHERFIVEDQRFLSKAQGKLG